MRIIAPIHPFLSALLLETTCLLLSKREDRLPLSEWIADCRREQARIALQIRMSEGLLPWAKRSIRQAFCGQPEKHRLDTIICVSRRSWRMQKQT